MISVKLNIMQRSRYQGVYEVLKRKIKSCGHSRRQRRLAQAPARFGLPLLAFLLAAAASSQPIDPSIRAKSFVDLLGKGDFGEAHSMLNDDLSSKLPTPTLEQIWRGIQKQAGTYRQSSFDHKDASEKSDVVFMTCEFATMKLDVRVPVDKDGRIAGLNFSQHADYIAPGYVDATSFREQDVMIGTGEWALHGALDFPAGKGPFPAIVLIQGSGNADKDSTLGPNKIFRDLAWGLASRGVAVLRFNKRSYEHPEAFSKLQRFTVKEETIDDAIIALTQLHIMPAVDAHRVFLLGHSLGGMLAPRIADAHSSLAGVIVMAGPTISLVDSLVPQYIHNFTLHGPMTNAQQAMVEKLHQQVARANDPALTVNGPASEMPLGVPASYWLDLRGYHPEELAQRLKQPMLILQGERDYQVSMDEFASWKRALAKRTNVRFHSYPTLNHLFLEGQGASSDEEYLKPGHIPQQVIEDIAIWVKTN